MFSTKIQNLFFMISAIRLKSTSRILQLFLCIFVNLIILKQNKMKKIYNGWNSLINFKIRILKKFLFFFAASLISLSSYSQTFVSTTAENKNVILEEFTGISCGFCPDGIQPTRQSMIRKGKNFLCRNEKIFLICGTSQN